MVDEIKELPVKPQPASTYSAVRWSAASKYGAMCVQFSVSLLLARLLAPEYFGLIGMATVVTGFAKTLKSLGFNAAIIQRKDLDQALLSTLFWVNVGFCGFITLMVILASPVATWIYQDDRVAPLVAVLALNILINSFATVPSSLLQRRLEFKKLAIREIGGVTASAVVGITCALSGFGVWSLALASITYSVTNVVLLNVVEPFWPSWTIDRLRLMECLKFGLNITGYNIFNYFSKHADSLIIGVFLGPLALGYYSLAYRFMQLPRNSMSRLIARVLFPKLSELQDADEKLARAFLRTVCAVAIVTFPAMAGLALLADPFIHVFLGMKWLPAAPIVSMLAVVGAIQSLTFLSGPIYLSKGRADWMFRWGIFVSITYVISFLVGVRWGLNGVAFCYMMANLFLFLPELAIPFKLVDGLTIGRLVKALAPFAIATGVMMVGVVAVSHWTTWYLGDASTGAVLGISVTTGVLTYALAILAMRPPAVSDYCSLVLGSKIKARLPIGLFPKPLKDKA